MSIMMIIRNSAKKAAFILAFASSMLAQTTSPQANRVTSVAGASWLTHLGRPFDETSMGKTGRLGPSELEPNEQGSEWMGRASSRAGAQTTILHGSDLYRLNCRGCHGEGGTGAPPEINSIINPVRAGSAALIMARMKNAGMSISHPEAAQLARQSQDALLQRLHNGGKDMPPFSHLNEVEIRALTSYLKQLADVPGAEGQPLKVQEPALRRGELIVKSTCHICHSASGENPDAKQLAQGAIPPLGTLTSRVNLTQFVRKVTHGAPILMGAPPLLCRGRMPVFYYLSEDEAADAYRYLSSYRPYQWAIHGPVVSPAGHSSRPSKSDLPGQITEVSFAGSNGRGKVATANDSANDSADEPVATLMFLTGILVTLLLAGGFVFTVRECRALSAKGAPRQFVPCATRRAISTGTAEPDGGRRVA